MICSCDRQNSVGNVVLFNRQNNQIQLSTNAYSSESGVNDPSSNGGLCPTCHRPLHDEPSQHSPAFMDSEYFRLLSSISSDLASDENNESRADATHIKFPQMRMADHQDRCLDRPSIRDILNSMSLLVITLI